MRATRVVIGMIVCLASVAMGQGSLTPPGAPGATMKTLSEIDGSIAEVGDAVSSIQDEARIDLATVAAASGYQHWITASGSYYLSENLEVTETSGIYIGAPDVTIDLNGFKIYRASGTGGYGVYMAVGADRATVKNGSVVGFSSGVYASTSSGYVDGCLFEKLTVSECSDYAIFASRSSTILDCTTHDNVGQGINANSSSLISRCASRRDGGFAGISASISSIIDRCIVIAHRGTSSSGGGISVSEGSSALGCMVSFCTNTNSVKEAGQGVGIWVGKGSIVKNCVVSKNDGDGIRVWSGNSLIEGNCSSYNGYNGGDAAGIHVIYDYYSVGGNRIVDNNVSRNDRGIDVDSAYNFIAKNTAHYNGSGGSGNYSIIGGNDVGTIQTSPIGAGAWDNFTY